MYRILNALALANPAAKIALAGAIGILLGLACILAN